MSNYAITGVLGMGTTLCAVDRIRSYLWHGRRVATNLDLKLENRLPWKNKTANVIRLPDRPVASDFEALGRGADVLDESQYGLIVLDELATWLNARSWDDPQRKRLLDWLVHSRKARWDVIFLIQHLEALDKQVRQMLVEYHVKVLRFDKVRIPFVSSLGSLLSLGLWDGSMPKMHIGTVIFLPASTPTAPLVTDRWIVRGTDLYTSYDTEQVITDNYDRGLYSYLPPWQQHGRYQPAVGWPAFVLKVRVFLGLDAVPRRKLAPVDKLKPLLRLSPDVRWMAARSLVLRGLL